MNLSIVILAAGAGTRMRSALPKVLHPIAGKPLVAHVIETAKKLAPKKIVVVYGHGGDQVRATITDPAIAWIEQPQRLGTGDAVNKAMPLLTDDEMVLVLYGDVPLISESTLRNLLTQTAGNSLAILTTNLANPFGYGRIVRNSDNKVQRIVEEKDANLVERAITEVNTGFLAAPAARLRNWLSRLTNNNAQGEYYLTDVVGLARGDGNTVATAQPQSEDEILGVNNRSQLADLERRFQRRVAEELMAGGATLADPARIDVRGTLKTGTDVMIDVNAVFEGQVTLGNNVVIGPNCLLRNATLGDDVKIFANCVIEESTIGAQSRIGPFARVRPETTLADHVHIGNFVEIKKSVIGPNSKVNHLSYVGDTTIGSDCNIGAGTITCNYDGANKHRTLIGDRVFVGSDTQLVAPISVGNDATIGAGTTVTKDVPENMLCISRVPQQVRAGWKRPTKKR